MRLMVIWMNQFNGWIMFQHPTGTILECDFSYDSLTDAKVFFDRWMQEHPGAGLRLQRAGEYMDVDNDGDLALAILKFQ